MSDWYWRVIALKAAFALTFLVCNIRADDTVKKLPFCDHNNVKDTPGLNDLFIVSTLDGRLTAFFTHNGNKAWTLDTQPLLSSNLHQVELTSGEKWVRLVPSLNGSLYSLSEDSIEPLPIDTVQLMSSSFKFSDGRVLVIGGARETTWLGLDAQTGRVVYECGTASCSSEQETAGASRDVLVLRRQTNTVRALDPRTGDEKWNFSVAEHMIALSPRECVGPRPTVRKPVSVAVGLPDGMITIKGTDGDNFSWQRKLDAPVAGLWRFHSGTVQNIDVLREATQTLVTGGVIQQPSLYIGVHDKQIYIQESRFYTKKVETAVSAQTLPWKLVTARPQVSDKLDTDSPLTTNEPNDNALSLITLYDNNGHSDAYGFFVYEQETCDQSVQVSEDAFDSSLPNISEEDIDHHHIHVHISSLWYWWKEVLLIAVSSALLMNLMIWPRFFAPKIRAITPLPTHSQEQMVVQMYDWRLENPLPKVPEYSSRFVNDFTVVRLLGKGGFGVVYEAVNNIDHCSYAVKIIILPRRESKRERVLREVRALAKLDHEHIVRYFNAWVEEPPPMWRQQRDAVWMRELDGTLAMTEEYTATSAAPNKSPLKDVKLDLNKCSEQSKRLRSQSCNDSFSIVFDENAPDHLTPSYPSHSPTNSNITPNSMAKPPISDDDSFIVFQNSENQDSNHEKTGNMTSSRNSSFDKRSERVKESEYKTESSLGKKKKKGHARHWSLGSGPSAQGTPGPRMYLFIQMQLCRPDSLHDWLRHNASCNSRADKINTLFSQIVSAVEYVHLAGLIHRDLKPRNILFAQDGRVKVGDFGLVTAMNETSHNGEPVDVLSHDVHNRHTYKVGTHLYMSPEQLMGHPYSYKVDIYSLGLILFELLQPFGTESERVACLLQLREGKYPQHFHAQYPKEMEVLKIMLSAEPSKRPTATGVRARAPLFQHTDQKYHFTLPAMDIAQSRQSDM